jgi:O-acetylserine/cysteine efflux transporter
MPTRDLLLVLCICLAWAGNFLTSKLALGEFPPLLFTALRLVLLALLLAPFVKRPAAGQWPRLVAVAICNGVLHFGLSFWSLRLSPNLASPAILMQSYVPMASLLAWWMLGERFGWRTGAAIALSFLGVLVLGLDADVLAHPAAALLMLVSAFFLALGTVLMRPLRGLDVFSQQGWTAIIGVGPLLVWSLMVEPPPLQAMRAAGWVGWFGVAYAALVASMVGHGLFYVLMQRHPVARVTPYLLFAPLLAAVLGIVVMHDRVGPRLWVGGAMVLGGVLAIALRNRVRARTPVPATEL